MSRKIQPEVNKLKTYEDFINYYTEKLGLQHVTSKRQENNQTISFYDPIANVWYNFYKKGYFRRLYEGVGHYNRGHKMMYPLNTRDRIKKTSNVGYKYIQTPYVLYKTSNGSTDYERMMKECVSLIKQYRTQPWIEKNLSLNNKMSSRNFD